MSAPDSANAPRAALSDLMLASARHVQAVLAGRSLSDSLAQTPAAQRPAVQAITFHVMRRLGLATELRRLMVKRVPPDALFDALLRVALALLDTAITHAAGAERQKHADEAGAKGESASVPGTVDAGGLEPSTLPRPDVPVYAAHTIVDQAVKAAKHMPAYKGLLNACLRRLTREHAALVEQACKQPEARWNFPAWWIRAVRRAYPRQWQALLAASDQPGPMTLRVNRRAIGMQDMCAALAEAGMDYERVGASGLVLARPRPVAEIPGFDQGWWSVQDASAQLAAECLAPVADEYVLDACAAPGGKTAHLLESADIRLRAVDDDAERMQRVAQNLARLRLGGEHVHLHCADVSALDQWWDGRPFDAVLADVPCTASGVVRRHPDIRWLRREADVERTAALQRRIADALWQTVRPGGRMLYATCSIFPEEGEWQAQRFAQAHADAQRAPAPGQLLPLPDESGHSRHDGFFYALFVKQD